jgi:hypothetical protein
MATFSNNVTQRVNRAITTATTVNPNSYAIVTYQVTAFQSTPGVNIDDFGFIPPINRYFGPGQSIPTAFSQLAIVRHNPQVVMTMTYSLQSGVEFTNTP